MTPVWAWIVAYITPMDEGNSTLSGSQEKKKLDFGELSLISSVAN